MMLKNLIVDPFCMIAYIRRKSLLFLFLLLLFWARILHQI